MRPKEYKKLGEKLIKIKDEISGYDKDVLVKTFRLPSGVIENFFINDNKNSVQIFPITADGRVVTVEQFRPGFESMNLELPGGGLEKDEDPQEAAERELREETGYEGQLHFLGVQPYSPYCTGKRYVFVANGCKKIDGLDLDENEFLRVIVWPMKKFRRIMQQGKVRGHDVAYMGLDYLDLL
jgi:ADP-ribose pyrophosphatase